MKKLLVLMMVAVMAVGMCACGGSTKDKDSDTSVTKDDSATSTGLNYEDYTIWGGLTIKYDGDAGFISVESGGEKYVYEDNSVYFGLDGKPAETWDDVIENSKENIFSYLSGWAEFDYETEQVVETKEEVEINGINWMKVTGTFKNVEEGSEFEQVYVSYYTSRETTDQNGNPIKLPLYVVGMPQGLEPTDSLEPFVDEFVSQITEADSWS